MLVDMTICDARLAMCVGEIFQSALRIRGSHVTGVSTKDILAGNGPESHHSNHGVEKWTKR